MRACAQKDLRVRFRTLVFKLSPRMQFIFDHLQPGQPVWDFCCDHGYLGFSAYRSGLFPAIYFVDQVEPIVEKLRARFQQIHSRPEIISTVKFLTCPGEDVMEEVTGTLVIAGVGAHTIFDILQGLHAKNFLKASRLVLVPQKDEEKLLEYLQEKAYFGYSQSLPTGLITERGRVRKCYIYDLMHQGIEHLK